MTANELTTALERMLPDNPDLAAVRNFARQVYAERGLSLMQLLYDLVDDLDMVMVYVQRDELGEVLGRRLHDADLDAIRESSLDDDFAAEITATVANALLVQAGISA